MRAALCAFLPALAVASTVFAQTLQSHRDFAAGGRAASAIALGDFIAETGTGGPDGIQDLAVTLKGQRSTNTMDGWDQVVILRGKSGGAAGTFVTPPGDRTTFDNTTRYRVGNAADSNPIAVVAADLNGAGALDLVVANENDSSITIILSPHDGTTGRVTHVTTNTTPRGVATGNFDGDGDQDIAVICGNASTEATVQIFLNNGSGTFSQETVCGQQPCSPYALGTNAKDAKGIGAGDFDGDGDTDIVVVTKGDDTIRFLRRRNFGNPGFPGFNIHNGPALLGGEAGLTVAELQSGFDGPEVLVPREANQEFALTLVRRTNNNPLTFDKIELDTDGGCRIAIVAQFDNPATDPFGLDILVAHTENEHDPERESTLSLLRGREKTSD